MFVRADTPKDVRERLLKAAIAAHEDPAVRSKLESMGFDVPVVTGQVFEKEIKEQIVRWRKLVEATGFTVN